MKRILIRFLSCNSPRHLEDNFREVLKLSEHDWLQYFLICQLICMLRVFMGCTNFIETYQNMLTFSNFSFAPQVKYAKNLLFYSPLPRLSIGYLGSQRNLQSITGKQFYFIIFQYVFSISHFCQLFILYCFKIAFSFFPKFLNCSHTQRYNIFIYHTAHTAEEQYGHGKEDTDVDPYHHFLHLQLTFSVELQQKNL